MGQYQQWLLAQEIDRRLKTEVETLETELLYLRDRIAIFELSVPEAENVILQALQEHLQTQASGARPGEGRNTPRTEPGWQGLPRLETPRVESEGPALYAPGMNTQMGMARDMLAFFDTHAQTDPRFPAWLQSGQGSAGGTEEGEHQVDEETRRLNENIQRWFERWHRQMAGHAPPEEVEHE